MRVTEANEVNEDNFSNLVSFVPFCSGFIRGIRVIRGWKWLAGTLAPPVQNYEL